MEGQTADFGTILDVLAKHDVEFIIVGGVSAALQGATVVTFDLDIVHSREPANLERLVAALEALGAHYREHTQRILKPDALHLASSGHHLLMTSAGPLDLLGEVGDGQGFTELVSRTVEFEIEGGNRVKALDLAVLIELKRRLGRDKDKAVLAVLELTLQERNKRKNA